MWCLLLFWAQISQAEISQEFRTIELPGADGTNRIVRVLVPKDSENPERRYPTLYYFQGWQGPKGRRNDGVVQSEIDLLHLNLVQKFLVDVGVAEPMIVANIVLNEPALDGKDGVKHQEALVKQIIPTLEGEFAGNGRRAVSGNSMGGLGALSAALRHPELFESVLLRQPFFFRDYPWHNSPEQIGDMLESRLGQRNIDSVYQMFDLISQKLPSREDSEAAFSIGKKPPQKLKFYLDVGSDDKGLLPETKNLRDLLQSTGANVAYREQPGADHGDKFTVMGLIDSFIASGFTENVDPTPLGKMIRRLSADQRLAPIVAAFYNNDLFTGLSLLAQASSEKSLVLSSRDLTALKALLKALMTDPNMLALLDRWDYLEFRRNNSGELEVKTHFEPGHCSVSQLSDVTCTPNRNILPLSENPGWAKALSLVKIKQEAVSDLTENPDCRPEVEPLLRELLQQTKEVLVKAYGSSNSLLEIEPAVSFKVTGEEKSRAVKIDNIKGLRIITDRAYGFWPIMNAIELNGKKAKFELSLGGLYKFSQQAGE